MKMAGLVLGGARVGGQRVPRTVLVAARGVKRSWSDKTKRVARRRAVVRFKVRANHATQPTACAVGREMKGHAGLAPAAADGWRWTD